MLKLPKPINPHNRSVPLRSRASKAEAEAIKAKAKHYCNGNLSAWIRLASIEYAPAIQDTQTEPQSPVKPKGAES